MLRASLKEASPLASSVVATTRGEASTPLSACGSHKHDSGQNGESLTRHSKYTGNAPLRGSRGREGCGASCPHVFAITQYTPPRFRRRKPRDLTPSERARITHAHHVNLRAFATRYGDKLAALTVTFSADVDNTTREKRFNSLATNILRPKYGAAIVIREFHQSGLLHYHVAVGRRKQDLHSSVSWQSESTFWRNAVKRYGLGRHTTLEPVRNGEAYVRYLLKDLTSPTPHGERVRRISYLGARQRRWVDRETGEIKCGELPQFLRVYHETFAWARGRAKVWRLKAQAFATMLHERGVITEPTAAGLQRQFTRHWFLHCKADIERMPVEGETDRRRLPPMSYAELREQYATARRRTQAKRRAGDTAGGEPTLGTSHSTRRVQGVA